MFNKFKLSTRIIILGAALVVCFAGVLGWLYPKIKGNMYDAKYLKTRHLVESAYSVAAFYAGQAAKGVMNEAQAQEAAIKVIQDMRYGDNDYFWVNDMAPRMIMHPFKPELIVVVKPFGPESPTPSHP